MIERRSITDLLAAVDRWTAAGSWLFVTAWTIDDPRYPELARTWSRVGKGSFRHPDGRIRTYLDRGEVLAMLPCWRTVHHRECLGPWHRHGDGPRERHGCVELVAQRRAV